MKCADERDNDPIDFLPYHIKYGVCLLSGGGFNKASAAWLLIGDCGFCANRFGKLSDCEIYPGSFAAVYSVKFGSVRFSVSLRAYVPVVILRIRFIENK